MNSRLSCWLPSFLFMALSLMGLFLTQSVRAVTYLDKSTLLSTSKAAPILLESNQIEVAIAPNGNYTVGTREGVPGNPNDNQKKILFGHPNPGTSATTLRVDGIDFWNYQSSVIGQTISPPQTQDGINTAVFEVGGIQLTQKLSIVPGPSGPADTLLVEYVLRNVDDVTHTAGLRIFWDTQLADNDGAPFRVPGLGEVTTETESYGMQIPQLWQCFDNLELPTVQTQGTLEGYGLVRPDRIVWANWGNLNDHPWLFQMPAATTMIGDSAVAIYWNERVLQPGESRVVATSYGMSNLDLTRADVTVGISHPDQLALINQTYDPNPFVIFLFIRHNVPDAQFIIQNLFAQIALPPGLILSPGQTNRIELGSLEPDRIVQAEFSVFATGEVIGELLFGITIGASNIQPVVLSRSVFIPEGAVPIIRIKPGFEQGIPLGTGKIQSSPGIADIDRDRLPEVVIGGSDGNLYSYSTLLPVMAPDSSNRTSPIPTLPPARILFQTPGGYPILSSPALADPNSDGFDEIFWGADDGRVYHLDLKNPWNGTIPVNKREPLSTQPKASPDEEDDLGAATK